MLASLRHPAYAQNAVRHVPKVLLTIPNLEPGPGAWAQGIRPGAAPPVTAVAGSALQDTQGSEYSWPVPGPGAQAQGPGPEPKAWGPGTRAQGPGPEARGHTTSKFNKHRLRDPQHRAGREHLRRMVPRKGRQTVTGPCF